MAFAEVGSGSQRASANGATTVASRSCAFPGNVTSGNLLVAGGSLYEAGLTALNVTGSRATYNSVLLPGSSGLNTFLAWGVATSSGAETIIVDPNVNAYIGFGIDEFSGQHATPADVDGGHSTGSSTSPSDSITTVADDALILGVLYPGGSSVITPNGSYTEIAEQENDSSSIAFSFVFRIATAAGAYSVDWTLGTSGSWQAQTHSFAPAAVAGGHPAVKRAGGVRSMYGGHQYGTGRMIW